MWSDGTVLDPNTQFTIWKDDSQAEKTDKWNVKLKDGTWEATDGAKKDVICEVEISEYPLCYSADI